MRVVAAAIAHDARQNLAGVDVVSVGPVYGEQADHGLRYSVMVIVPERDGPNFGCRQIMLDIAQDPFMANAYRIALIVSLEDFFGRVQVFGDALTLAKYCQKEWPGEKIDRDVILVRCAVDRIELCVPGVSPEPFGIRYAAVERDTAGAWRHLSD